MRRRDFISLLGGATATWPLAARAQQPPMPVIGFLDGQSFDIHLMTAFRQALKDADYIEDKNVSIYFRSANGQTDRLVTLVGDIVGIEDIFDIQFRRRFAELINQIAQPDRASGSNDGRPRHRS
jgi:hypothetical protein